MSLQESPVSILTIFRRLGTACTVFFGPHGAVSDHARQLRCSRQHLYREAHRVVHDLEADRARARCADLERQLADARQRSQACQAQLAHAVVIDGPRQAHFAATAQALGVSLTQAQALLSVLLGEQTPSVPTLGRYAQAAARKAAQALAVVDATSRPRVSHLAADAIHCGRVPVLSAIEPDSLCWLVSRRLAGVVTSAPWVEELRQLPALRYLVSDAGSALRKAVALERTRRQGAGLPALHHGLDVFHALHAGQRALRLTWQRVARALDRADRRQCRYDRCRRQGKPLQGHGHWLVKEWQRAEQAFDQASAMERAWQQVRQTLTWFTPDGRLQVRAQAAATLAEALPQLTGPLWAATRGLLQRPETLSFLDEAWEAVLAAEPEPAARGALLDLEGLRRQPERWRGDSRAAAAARGIALVAAAQLAKEDAAWPARAERLRRVLRRAWRASSLVECVNSVMRMQQTRHRRLTQGLLDLKRWYWNCHRFRRGRRKGKTPYELLGVALPPGSWWDLLQLPPDQLRQQMSAPRVAA
jgi:hypothetical protein